LLAVAVSLITRVLLGVLSSESVGNPLVRGISLPVDAVGANLQQDRDAVSGPAGHLGRRDAGVQLQGNRRVPQVVRGGGRMAQPRVASSTYAMPDTRRRRTRARSRHGTATLTYL
jgi:hypothetical protein